MFKLFMSIVNPLMPKSDKLLISSFNISPESSIKATRIRGNDHQLKKLLMVKKISLSIPLEMQGYCMENMHTDV